jgi:hypothetical protein
MLLSLKKPPKAVLQPLMDNMADKLPTWKAPLLQRSGRLTLIKTTLVVMPVYIAINIECPP